MSDLSYFIFTLLHRNSDESNLIDPFKFVEGIIVGPDGSITESVNYATTNFIEVSPSTGYEGHSDSLSSGGKIFFKLVEYDENFVLVDGAGATNVDSFTTNADTKYVRLTMRSTAFGSDLKTNALIEGSGTNFAPYYTSRVLRPIYEDLERTLNYEKGQNFLLEKLNGDFKLSDLDYDYLIDLMETDLDTKFLVEIADQKNEMPDLLQEFYITDCDFNADDRLITVKSKTANAADEILRNYKTKIDFSKINIPLSSVTVFQRSILQIYQRGATVVTNVKAGEVWEEPVGYYKGRVYDRSLLTGDHYCARINDQVIINSGYSSELSTDVTGTYDYAGDVSGFPSYDDGTYRIIINVPNTRWEIRRISDNALLYVSNYGGGLEPEDTAFFGEFEGAGSETGTLYLDVMDIYFRLITNNGFIIDNFTSPGTGYATSQRVSYDLAVFKNDYNFVAPASLLYINSSSNFNFDSSVREDPKSVDKNFGKISEPYYNAGKYFNGIASGASLFRIPICPASWRSVQAYLQISDNSLAGFDIANTRRFRVDNAMNIVDILRAFLQELEIDIMHEYESLFSEFLYGDFPYTTFGFQRFFDIEAQDDATTEDTPTKNTRKFLLDKKAFLEYNFKTLPNKLELSLEEFFTILNTIYRINWHVDGRKLILEHEYWYKRGGSYSSDIVEVDTTLISNPRNGKPWSYAQNKFSFNKIEIPERIETTWIERSNEYFDGFPIDLKSSFVDKENIEENQLDVFTNIDYLFFNRNVNDSGFLMVEAVEAPIESGGSDVWHAAFTEALQDGVTPIVLQNGLLTWPLIHEEYWVYNLPTSDVSINGLYPFSVSNNITRKKEQDIVFPYLSNLANFGLIKTSLGNGELISAKISMGSRMVEAKIKHDTEL